MRASSIFGDRLHAIASTPAPGGPPLPYRLYVPPAEATREHAQGSARYEVFVPPDRLEIRRHRRTVDGLGVAVERFTYLGRGAAGPWLPPASWFQYRDVTRLAEPLRCTECYRPAEVAEHGNYDGREWIVANPHECLQCAMLRVTPRIITPEIGRAENIADLHDLLDSGSFPFLVLIGTEHLFARPSWNARSGALMNVRALATRNVCACVSTQVGCDRLYLYRAAPDASMSWREQWLVPEAPPEPVQERI